MFALISELKLRPTLMREGPALAASMLIAETFYKLHSFTLECVAFLATWYVLSSIQHFALHGRGEQHGQ